MDRGALSFLLLAACACGPGVGGAGRVLEPGPAPAPGPRARLPVAAGRFAPALVTLDGHGALGGDQLADVDACEGCHADVADQLQTSAHALSSFNNPLYRFAIDGFRERVGKRESQACGGCHDMALLIDDAMLGEIEAEDPRAHAGITCRVCHGVDTVRADGNGSYVLSRGALPLPERGDAESTAQHVAAVEPLDDAALCGSCHRSFLSPETGNDHFLSGMDDFGAWRGSPYNGNGAGRVDDPVEKASCRDCHMAREPAELGDLAAGDDGMVASHRFLGGHTWLAAMRGDAEQLARLRAFLRDTVTVDVAAARSGDGPWQRPADGAELAPGATLELDVVVRNVGVGHAFPGGVRDAVDSWLSLEVRDARGALLASTRDDDSAHRFRVLMGDRHGRPQLERNTEDFHEAIVDHTVPARDARVVRYAFAVPPSLSPARQPLQVTATLLHRSRNLEFQAGACEASKSARGRAFSTALLKRIDAPLDPCAPQPVSEIGQTTVWLGRGAALRAGWAPQPALAIARRLYEHGLGLLAELPQEADRARGSLLAALALLEGGAEGDATALRRAQVHAALGAVYAGAPCGPSAPAGWPSCEGRLQAALRWLDLAEQVVPGHPAVANIRARAYARRLRWAEAADALGAAHAKVPLNLGLGRRLATTLSGLRRHDEALAVAQHGLTLSPRDDDLLRVQARALSELGAADDERQAAWDAYERHRRARRPATMRALCLEHDPRCQQERRAVHTHQLEPPAR